MALVVVKYLIIGRKKRRGGALSDGMDFEMSLRRTVDLKDSDLRPHLECPLVRPTW